MKQQIQDIIDEAIAFVFATNQVSQFSRRSTTQIANQAVQRILELVTTGIVNETQKAAAWDALVRLMEIEAPDNIQIENLHNRRRVFTIRGKWETVQGSKNKINVVTLYRGTDPLVALAALTGGDN